MNTNENHHRYGTDEPLSLDQPLRGAEKRENDRLRAIAIHRAVKEGLSLLNLQEAADFVRVSRSTLRRMAIEKVIPCSIVRAGPRKKIFRFRAEELTRWLRAQQRQYAAR